MLRRCLSRYRYNYTGPRLPYVSNRSFAATTSWSAKAPNELLQRRSLDDEKHHRSAREWVKGFTPEDIPKEGYDISYARSSGPGGQHVNKTNSKAILRCPLQPALGSWLPSYILPHLAKSPHYLSSPPSLLISSQQSRSASSNAAGALKLLHRTIVSAAESPIQGETAEVQKDRVKGLIAAEKVKRRLSKDKLRMSKASRRGEF